MHLDDFAVCTEETGERREARLETGDGSKKSAPSEIAPVSRLPSPVRFSSLAILLLFTSISHSAPRKSSPVKPSVARPAAETVYVAAPAPVVVRETRAIEPVARESDSRKKESAFSSGPLREYPQAFGVYGGFNVADVLGTTPYAIAFWELYPSGQAYFFQFDMGVGTVQSSFSEDLIGGFNFDHNLMVSLDALGGYSMSGLPGGNGRGGGLFPYFLAGITAFWQGGLPIVQESTPNVGGVVGFGNRMKLPVKWLGRSWAVNYVVRDNIYSQKLGNNPSLTQNFQLLIGVQKYF